jgi:predicted dehydrogenase
MSENDAMRLGSIGLGWWGGVLAEAARSIDGVELAGCFARSAESRQGFAETHGCQVFGTLDDLLTADIDGVLIATPHTTHAGLAVAAAKAGKHVFVDKPLTLTVAEANRAIAAAEDAGVVLQVGHNRRRQPANRWIKDAVDNGDLGGILELSADHSSPLLFNPNLAPWRRRLDETPVGGMSALGIHQIDTFHYLAGPIAGVFTRTKRLLPEGEVDDTSSILFEFDSGAQGHLFTSMATGPVVEVTVHGTRAVARNTGDGARLTLQPRGSTEQEEIPLEPLDTIADQLAEFVAAIHGERSPETDGAEGRRAVSVLEAIVESATTSRWVEVVYP